MTVRPSRRGTPDPATFFWGVLAAYGAVLVVLTTLLLAAPPGAAP